jgi:hypothetical protein
LESLHVETLKRWNSEFLRCAQDKLFKRWNVCTLKSFTTHALVELWSKIRNPKFEIRNATNKFEFAISKFEMSFFVSLVAWWLKILKSDYNNLQIISIFAYFSAQAQLHPHSSQGIHIFSIQPG